MNQNLCHIVWFQSKEGRRSVNSIKLQVIDSTS